MFPKSRSLLHGVVVVPLRMTRRWIKLIYAEHVTTIVDRLHLQLHRFTSTSSTTTTSAQRSLDQPPPPSLDKATRRDGSSMIVREVSCHRSTYIDNQEALGRPVEQKSRCHVLRPVVQRSAGPHEPQRSRASDANSLPTQLLTDFYPTIRRLQMPTGPPAAQGASRMELR